MGRLIKYIFVSLGIILLISLLLVLGFWWKYSSITNSLPNNNSPQVKSLQYGKLVNTFIGTGGFPSWVCGMNFPGATVPFGMVRLSPETTSIFINTKGLNTSGYYYGDNKILGFSHTRLAGTGATDGGHFLFTPTTTERKNIDFTEDYYHNFSHSDETTFPGYYKVKFEDEDITSELTSTERVGMHRYTFSKDSKRNLLLKITNSIDDRGAKDGVVVIDPINNNRV